MVEHRRGIGETPLSEGTCSAKVEPGGYNGQTGHPLRLLLSFGEMIRAGFSGWSYEDWAGAFYERVSLKDVETKSTCGTVRSVARPDARVAGQLCTR